jgi:hypothetical protein
MEHKFSRLMVGLVLVVGFNGGLALAQDSAGRCSGRPLVGSFAFKATGVLYVPEAIQPNGDPAIIAQIGVASFDGNGRFNLIGMNSFAGHIVPYPSTGVNGSYKMEANCTGTISFVDLAGSETIYFVLADNGTRMFGLYTVPPGHTTPGPVVTVDFTRL